MRLIYRFVPGKTSFFEFYFTGAVGKGFQDLYDNRHRYQDYFTQFWQQLATRFQTSPYVLGYELINEPVRSDSIIL